MWRCGCLLPLRVWSPSWAHASTAEQGWGSGFPAPSRGALLEARGVTLVVVGDDLAAAVEPAFRAACDRIGIPCRACSVDGAEAAVATAFGDHRLAICRPDAVVTHLSAASLPDGVADGGSSVAAEALLLSRRP